jgi:hypothetical protein
MISWGLDVNDYGNAILDDDGNFKKVKEAGVTEQIWSEMVAFADEHGYKGGNYKKLNLPFENKLLGQPQKIRERMINRVEDFTYDMLVNVFNSENTASLAIEAILDSGSYETGPKARRIEDPKKWTPQQIQEKAAEIKSDKGPAGEFDD